MSSSNQALIRALRGATVSPPPVWLMRQAGRYLPEYREVRRAAGNFLDLCYTPDLATEVTLQPIRRFGLDAAILFSDILVVPDGLGQEVTFREGEGPCLEPVRTDGDLVRLAGTLDTDRLAPVYETVGRLRQTLPADVALLGFAGAPWTVATYMVEGGSSRDFAAVKRWAYGDAESFGGLVSRLVDATADHLAAQIRAGADAVQIFDSWAGVLSAPAFERWVIEPTRRIVARLRDAAPEIPIIGFPRGAGALYVRYGRETGVDAVSLDTTVSAAWAAEAVQPTMPVQGNLDPQLLVVGGDAMRAEVEGICRHLAAGPFVFNLGHGIVPDTPPDHVAQLVGMVRDGAPAS